MESQEILCVSKSLNNNSGTSLLTKQMKFFFKDYLLKQSKINHHKHPCGYLPAPSSILFLQPALFCWACYPRSQFSDLGSLHLAPRDGLLISGITFFASDRYSKLLAWSRIKKILAGDLIILIHGLFLIVTTVLNSLDIYKIVLDLCGSYLLDIFSVYRH